MAQVVYSFPQTEEFFKLIGVESLLSKLDSQSFIYQNFDNSEIYAIQAEPKLIQLADEPEWDLLNSSYEGSLNEDEYKSKLSDLLDILNAGALEKLVFSRRQVLDKPNFSMNQLLLKMRTQYPKAFVYALQSEKFGTWIGASPEILIDGENKNYRSVSLAGTKANDAGEWTNKEFEEQQIVTDYILEKLENSGARSIKYSETEEVSAGPVKHLKTNIDYQFEAELIELVNSLSPTPAVCGVPLNLAKEYILNNENYNRQLYSGAVGFSDGNQAKIFVNLRCMQVAQEQVALYVGGGITSKSDWQEEWRETELKARTLLDLI